MTGITGSVCQSNGFYRCSEHFDSVELLWKGNVYPSCNHDRKHGAVWQFIVLKNEKDEFVLQTLSKQASKIKLVI